MTTQFPYPVAQTIIQKKTMGRRKIEIKPIQNKNRLQVTFSKRRGGVFKKASELSVLCGAEVAIIVRSTANKVYTFGTPDVDSVIHWFETGSSSHVTESRGSTSSKREYNEAVRKLEKEKKRVGEELHVPFGMNWWEIGFEGMGLYELEEFKAALDGLKSKVSKRVDEIEEEKVGMSLLGFSEGDQAACNKYGDWKQALLCQDALFHAGETSSMFGVMKVEEDTGAGCSSSSNLMAYPTGGQSYVDNSCLEDIFKNMS